MCINCLPTNATDTKFAYWKWTDLADQIKEAGFDPKKLNEQMVMESTQSMMRALKEEVSGTGAAKRLAAYELNVFTHNSLKNYRFLTEAQQAASQLKGADLKQWMKTHTEIYYKNYHSTELQAAVQVTRAKEQWAEIEEMAEVLPWLTFHAIRDERTRDSHAALDGKTYRANDPIWRQIFPPLDYNCRCFVTQEFDGTESPKPSQMPTIPKAFVRDYGSEPQARIFTDKSPFLDQSRQKQLGLNPVSFAQPDFKAMNEAMSKMLPKLEFGWSDVTPPGVEGKILNHVFANAKTLDREVSQLAAVLKTGEKAYRLPEMDRSISGIYNKYNNTDAIVNKQFLELKKQDGNNLKRFFKNHFYKAAGEQMADIMILELNTLEWETIKKQLDERWKNSNPSKVIICHSGINYVLLKDTWKEQITKLKSP